MTQDNGLAISTLGPVSAKLPNGVAVNVSGDYPFVDDLTITLSGLPNGQVQYPLYIRIPSWATAATIAIGNGAPVNVGSAAGTMYKVQWSGANGPIVSVTLATNPSIRVETDWFNNSTAVYRGALLYALHLEEQFSVLAYNGLNSYDYDIVQPTNTTIAWNSALVMDPTNPGGTMTFQRVGPVPDVPFSSTIQSNIITAQARVVNGWGFAPDGSAMPPPQSPVDCSAAGACGGIVTVTLVPFGTTHLRISEIPWTTA